MKKCLLICFVLATEILAAQPVLKLYGYSQEVIPGNIPVVPDENGGIKPKRAVVNTQYYIYVQADSAVQVQLVEVWLAGQWDTVSSQSVVATPVIVSYPEKKTLVPVTRKKVLQLNPGDILTGVMKPSAALQKLMKANALVVAYLWKGKKYYAALKKLVVLPVMHGI